VVILLIGTAIIVFHIPGANSLKDKRRVVSGLKQRIRARFNVSFAEIEDQDVWRRAVFGVASVSNSSGFAHRSIQAVVEYCSELRELQLVDYSIQVF
jgi:uncharacterized protein YlxP (DUF503 family)